MTCRIVQITDLHLFAEPEGQLLGHNTWKSFEAVLAQVSELSPEPQLLLLTGDLAQDHSLEAYQRLDNRLGELGIEAIATFGNHDNPKQLLNQNLKALKNPFSYTLGGWQIILLNSQLDNHIDGFIPAEELLRLKTLLEETDLPTIIALHHQPVSVGSPWLDQLSLQNREAFWDAIQGMEQVKAVVWGHIHQTFESEKWGIKLLSCPSTCLQFLPQSPTYQLDLSRGPGFRVFDLFKNGTFESRVIRLRDFHYTVDQNAPGY